MGIWGFGRKQGCFGGGLGVIGFWSNMNLFVAAERSRKKDLQMALGCSSRFEC